MNAAFVSSINSSTNSNSSTGASELTETEGTAPNTNEYLYYVYGISSQPGISSSGLWGVRVKANLSSASDIDNMYFEFDSQNQAGNYPFSIESGGGECRVYQANNINPYIDMNPDYVTDPNLKDPADDTTFFTYLATINTSTSYTYVLTATPEYRTLIYFHCYLASGKTAGDYTLYLDAQPNAYTGSSPTSFAETMTLSSVNSCRGQRTECRKKCRKDKFF